MRQHYDLAARRLGMGAVALAVLLSLGGQALADTIVVTWNNAALQAVRNNRLPGPPVVARGLFIVHECIFDAWAAYDATAVGTQLGGSLRRPAVERTEANKQQAISFAAYDCLKDVAAAEGPTLDALMQQLGYDPADTSTDPTTPTGVGHLAAQAVIDFRHHDGSNQLGDLHAGAYSDYTGYAPVNTLDQINDPNRWQPQRFFFPDGSVTAPGFIAPHWGHVVPFAMPSGDFFRADLPGPSLFPDPAYRQQAVELLAMSRDLNDRTKMIAEYWADGPHSELPPGHWDLFAQFVSQRDGHGTDEDAKMFFAMTGAIFDAGIMAWDAKRVFDYVRPITAIRFLFAGKGVLAWGGAGRGRRVIDGGTWKPFQPDSFITPPFPEYVSGHSSFSAAGAEVLMRFTGSDQFGNGVTLAAGSSRTEPGLVPRRDVALHWDTFSDAADEAGISRRYGGIHFREGDLDARAVGRLVGALAWQKAQSFFNGTAAN